MKSNKYIYHGLRATAMLLLAAFCACSNIEDDERLVFVESRELPTPGGTVGGVQAFVPTVLVEDFTGQKCTWCPQGTAVLEEQIGLYGADRVIPVAVHSGPQGFKGTATAVGLMTNLGIYYWNQNGFTSTTSQPTAVINKRYTSDDRDAWAGIIYNELARKAAADIKLETEYDEATRTANITVTCLALEPTDCHMQLWLTESGITAMQTDGGVTKRDYTHNHVLRDAINGQDGEEISIGAAPVEKTFSYVIPDECVPENCEVVAFLYNEDGVLQAGKKNLSPSPL